MITMNIELPLYSILAITIIPKQHKSQRTKIYTRDMATSSLKSIQRIPAYFDFSSLRFVACVNF